MYQVNVNITFSFDMGVDAKNPNEAKKKVEELIADGSINLQLPPHKNLDLAGLKVKTVGEVETFNADSYDDSESVELLKAFHDMNNRISSNNKR